ncbi:MAG: hypothetical protein A3A10_00370 [Candidatus Tagabacteria bacterium RIFCSPLOWO2_01_FULL_42_9]|uniref:DUF1573 domain-containing protein n=1 Tax=Candidatus Tagabacteria bacterium RIFCSPLOWO2_01_FULL_42_9 TaxID=1802296 RepID=A0A1G2LZC4_9BACT|nr:MAG: hypothetical protein A3A10_00370 [Candidatus Tagabacteria bacterium RIFCSPLOWO2_01_FULL_42_9]
MAKIKLIPILAFVILGMSIAVFGYFRAVPGVKNKTENLPKIEIFPNIFDFGEIEFGKIVEHSFRVKNSGNEILEIKRVATSCACTTAKISKKEINPGEEAELLVNYDTAAMGKGPHGRGKQERIIYVKSGDPLNPQVEIMIYADVK